jgi:hypothetical protein
MIKKTLSGKLYEAEVQVFHREYNVGKSKLFSNSVHYAFCSTTKPAVFFPNPYDSKEYRVDFLNPGAGYLGYNLDAYKFYWFICHGVLNKEISTLRSTAASLGYRGDLQEKQIGTQNPFLLFK